MISLDNLTVSYGGWTLFDNISFLINPKDRIGLVGKNGAGKTTLLKLIVGELKSGNTVYVENEIKAVRAACEGKILKVIIETCLLTENEKIAMCDIVTRSGADYIKTSTGFSTGGATFDDIKLFSEHIGSNVKMKAAGGISSLDDAERFISLGCDRLGTSRIVKLAKGLDASGY